MANLTPADVIAFMPDLLDVQEAVQSGTTQDLQQQRLYRQWPDLCFTLLVGPTLQDSSLPQVNILQVYGHMIQHAH